MDRKELLKTLNLSRFVAFDFETTGLDTNHDKIIEIAALRFEDGIITDRFVELVNPERPISRMITDITGISNKMVRNAPIEESIIDVETLLTALICSNVSSLPIKEVLPDLVAYF